MSDGVRRHTSWRASAANEGRIEALNNNWETLVRRGRGYRDLTRMLRRLRFMVVDPIRTGGGLERFLALGVTPPYPVAIAA